MSLKHDKDYDHKKKKDLKGKIKEEFNLLKQQLDEKKHEAQEYKHLLQRIKAEFDNYKKRVLKENEEIVKNANEKLIQDMLPIMDAFERGLSPDHYNNKDENMVTFVRGMEMILKRLKDLFQSCGLQEIQALNQDFDPQYHDALMVEESESCNSEQVLEVLEKGYCLGAKVIRPAKVKVGKPAVKKEEKEEKAKNGSIQVDLKEGGENVNKT
ncbi:MAG: nucleotide exchange factor GrpE [Spirochaetes bacterium]|nr:nucleotide exchange factor GrpE [Spirochaetota bacterium]